MYLNVMERNGIERNGRYESEQMLRESLQAAIYSTEDAEGKQVTGRYIPGGGVAPSGGGHGHRVQRVFTARARRKAACLTEVCMHVLYATDHAGSGGESDDERHTGLRRANACGVNEWRTEVSLLSGGFQKQHMVGTMQYMAPEVLMRQVPGYSADVYAFGKEYICPFAPPSLFSASKLYVHHLKYGDGLIHGLFHYSHHHRVDSVKKKESRSRAPQLSKLHVEQRIKK